MLPVGFITQLTNRTYGLLFRETTMKRLIPALLGFVIVGGMAPALADIFAPNPLCSRPFRGAYGYDRYEVERYQTCLKDFIRDQGQQAQNHLDAADRAAEEWKTFVREANAGM